MEKSHSTNTSEILQVLLHSIQDSQETIRFVESKTGFCVAVFTGHIVVLYSLLDDFVSDKIVFPFWYWVLLSVLLLLQLSFVYVVYRIVVPRFNPVEGLNYDSANSPAVDLFLNSSPKTSWEHIFIGSGKILKSFSVHLKEMSSSTEEDLITSMLFELHKVSYIRNAKISKLKVLTRLTLIASLFLIILIVATSILTINK